MNWWMFIAIVEFIVIVLYLLSVWGNYRWAKQEMEMMGVCIK